MPAKNGIIKRQKPLFLKKEKGQLSSGRLIASFISINSFYFQKVATVNRFPS